MVQEVNPRRDYPVLVPEAGATGMVAVIRSLGRSGYPVHACASRADAIGLQSKMALQSETHPEYQDAQFIPWLRSYVRTHNIKVIVPSEGFYLGIRHEYSEFESLLAVSCSEKTVFSCLSKSDVFDAFNRAGPAHPVTQHIPRSLVFDAHDCSALRADLRSLNYPVFVKTDACHGYDGQDGTVLQVHSYEMAEKTTQDLLSKSSRVLVQEMSVGRKATVNLCYVRGQLLAESMCLSTHESPHTGGLTSLRHTWWHDQIYRDALARVEYLGWDGVAMLEYKWHGEAKEFAFIEINTRYWAALHLDLFAGTDFPRIQLDAILGIASEKSLGRQRRTIARMTVPADFGYALSRARDRDVLLHKRLWAMVEFGLIGLRQDIRADLLFPGDRRLYFLAWWRFLKSLFR